jgi:hypothetical protein
LELLYLEETNVGDRGLLHLSGLSSVAQIRVYGTQVTSDGVSAFRKIRPDCDCVWAERAVRLERP